MKYPGTTIEIERGREREGLEERFAKGGLTLSQIANLTGTESYDIQNWVRRGFCLPPVQKKYGIKSFCRIATICLLRDILSITEITGLLTYINGMLDDESDNLIGDDELYFCILRGLQCMEGVVPDRQHVIIAVDAASTCFLCDHEDVSERLHNVLEVVMYACIASKFRQKTKACLDAISLPKAMRRPR